MTENEALVLIQAIPSKIWEQLQPCDNEAIEMAYKALEEIQQYRAIGTPAEIYEKIGGLDVELGKYYSIGTVEEFKALKEKNEPKKAITEPFYGGRCSVCNGLIPNKTVKYCSNCGQKLDWN